MLKKHIHFYLFRTISDIIEKISVLIALREASENTNGKRIMQFDCFAFFPDILPEQKRKKRKTEAEELKSSNSSPSGATAKKSKKWVRYIANQCSNLLGPSSPLFRCYSNDIIPPGTSVRQPHHFWHQFLKRVFARWLLSSQNKRTKMKSGF